MFCSAVMVLGAPLEPLIALILATTLAEVAPEIPSTEFTLLRILVSPCAVEPSVFALDT